MFVKYLLECYTLVRVLIKFKTPDNAVFGH